MEDKKIIVKSRKEFVDLFKKIFIANCDKGDNEIFNFGWALNNWTGFHIKVKGEEFYTIVDLE
jgi:hypothetical protein